MASDGSSDLAAVVADDALLDALSGTGPAPRGGDAVTRALAAWRRNVDSEPISLLVDVDTALALVGRRPHRPVVGWIVDAFRLLSR